MTNAFNDVVLRITVGLQCNFAEASKGDFGIVGVRERVQGCESGGAALVKDSEQGVGAFPIS